LAKKVVLAFERVEAAEDSPELLFRVGKMGGRVDDVCLGEVEEDPALAAPITYGDLVAQGEAGKAIFGSLGLRWCSELVDVRAGDVAESEPCMAGALMGRRLAPP
jgi:hypothetical protein